jgi:3-phosphoshikimate 1-carboxyvinyltransferase
MKSKDRLKKIKMNLENSLYKVELNSFQKQITVPSSKSYSNRALILGALRGNDFLVSNLSTSTDVENLLAAFENLGLILERDKDSVKFKNSFPKCEKKSALPIKLKTGDGGTTNRFLMALLALGSNEYEIYPSEKMADRPIEDLIVPLRELGVSIESGTNTCWMKIKGPITTSKNELKVDCQKSTQFASALKLVLNSHPIKINLENVKSSSAYLQMTDEVIAKANLNNYFVVPVDFSSVSYPLALASLLGEVTILNCHGIDKFQADSAFIQILESIGSDISFTPNGLHVSSKSGLKPFKVDGSKFPDLVMTLAFVASYLNGVSEINNLEILKYKESDRLSGIMKILNEFEIEYSFDNIQHSLKIFGSTKISPNKTIVTDRDHRMVMMSYLFLRKNSGGLLANTDCIAKSFPEFLNVMK